MTQWIDRLVPGFFFLLVAFLGYLVISLIGGPKGWVLGGTILLTGAIGFLALLGDWTGGVRGASWAVMVFLQVPWFLMLQAGNESALLPWLGISAFFSLILYYFMPKFVPPASED